MTRRTHRRDFLKQSATAAAGFWVYGGLTPKESKAANDKLNIACIGVGGKGSSDTDQAGSVGNIPVKLWPSRSCRIHLGLLVLP